MEKFKKQWELARTKVDEMSLRERFMIFAAVAVVFISLINNLLLDPLLAKQKTLSQQVVQQQAKMRDQQATIQMLVNAKRADKNSPLRVRVEQLKLQLEEQETYLKSRSDRLVQPEKIASLLEQVLNKQGKLQLIKLETLPLAPLIEKPTTPTGNAVIASSVAMAEASSHGQQIFKHGVKITVRGSYLDLLHYLTSLENLPTQMFWGEIDFKVDTYPNAEVSLTLFTLSLDKIWLTV